MRTAIGISDCSHHNTVSILCAQSIVGAPCALAQSIVAINPANFIVNLVGEIFGNDYHPASWRAPDVSSVIPAGERANNSGS